jgi:osmoprotectant transport system permease protein
MSALLEFWSIRVDEVLRLTAEHVWLVFLSTVVAIVVGVPAGILASRHARLGAAVAGAASVVQAIPSLALFGFLLPLPLIGGVGATTAVAALILYALLPIIRTTATGIRSIDPAILAAADAMGMSPRERLAQVELPLAIPAIVAGIRIAAVIGVGTVTIAAAIGAGGLGEYIYRGLSMVNTTVILAGAIPVALLALTIDGLLLAAGRLLAPRRTSRRVHPAAVGIVLVAGAAVLLGSTRGGERVVVGSKNFTEQVILGELMAQVLERFAGLEVERRLNLGGTFICDRALQAGDIDLYVEYTGTALTAVFDQPVERDSSAVLARVRELYAGTGRSMLDPLGFNNSFAILVRRADAEQRGLTRLSELAVHAPSWRAGFGYEFLERPDGYPGLARVYGLRFAEPPRIMDLTLIYRAIDQRQVDVIAGDATAGLIEALDLTALEDDRRYFPPYDAVPVVHTQTLLRYPQMAEALAQIAGKVSVDAMRRMNYAVDAEGSAPAAVVSAFLDALARGV